MDANESWPWTTHEGINQSSVDLEGAPVTMGQIDVNIPEAGKVLVTYDGLCAGSPGDLLVMAASDTEGWLPNAGNVNVEAISSDLNYNNFSHSRVYDVTAGLNSFYAVAENYVELDGDGIGYNYGSLTVTYFPDDTDIEVGLNDLIQINDHILVYPSPTNGLATISYKSSEYDLFKTDIIDVSGKVVKEIGTLSTLELQLLEIDLTGFERGIYFIRMMNETKIGTAQIILQ